MTAQSFSRSKALQTKALQLIPAGCHTYAKGLDQYPVLAPGFIARGRGAHVWDVDGNEFIEYGMGNRAVTLGHAFPAVVEAVQKEIANGCNFTRPSPIEVECAEQLLSLIGADMVKFCKDGSDATSGAMKLARAYTGRDYVACCSDHPFFSVDDWFMGTTLMGAGVPQATKDLTLTFRYDDLDGAAALFDRYPGKIAAIILEPSRGADPKDDFLHRLKELCHRNGALFVLDEMITGFRWANGGGQAHYDIEPDLSTFGKALGNGFSVSALCGKREFMRLGGFHHYDKPRVFLLSTTHGGETGPLAAAIATIETYKQQPVIETLHRLGASLRDGFEQAIRRHGLGDYVSVVGRDSCLVFATFDRDRRPSQGYRSLFLQEMVRGGVICPSLAVCYSHTANDIARTLDAVDASLAVYARALDDGFERHLHGRPSQIVQRSFNVPGAFDEDLGA
ncbi:glutamate-1-semialdehyde 2,1-aminomutase [Rhodomicrobium udaipurense JA643]|uniref:Glutamate-1-semialdehyde 2,1-aminomutase n=1 Tax=Rhodomicrobium udaipurense TaxID=1202716 RepID=A0A8I1GFU7_9HYPH|nr:glutamate-1-semialdehyde 2,1-aminomutase [Rhodomicrobium udaipurense]KAI95211.1 glutamate-1-semialdehyde 2,1-aminomutase [Rhodomicrobium udaipurense JA643]MBJ7542525.1 glutamate-1-semialdehyde 2,1-aminomutase [Rhodomicrobium udaipurense]